MAKATKTPEPSPTPTLDTSADALVRALVQAIQLTKPIEKKTAINRKPGSPWDPKDGSKKVKLKRKMYQHGLLIDDGSISNEEIVLLNKVKVGRYCDGWVKVFRRKDHGIDIDYPVKTASQHLKLAAICGGRGLSGLLERCIEESSNPKTQEELDED